MFVNTGQEFDGSDSGARPDEAVSWGKIKMTASPVKVGYSVLLGSWKFIITVFGKRYSQLVKTS